MMAFGAKIKLSVNTSGASAFRNEIQKFVNEATKSNPIKLNKVEVRVSNPKTQLSAISKQLNESGGLVVKLKEVDAKQAITKLRADIQHMLSGLNIVGLKDFLGSDGVDETVEDIEKAKQSASEWAAQMKTVNDIQSKLGSTYKTALSGNQMIVDPTKITEITSAYTVWQQKVEQLKATKVALSAEELNALQQEGIAIQQKISLIQREQVEQIRSAKESERAAAAEEVAARKQISIAQQTVSLKAQVQRYILSNSKAYKAYGSELDGIMQLLQSEAGLTSEQLKQIRTRFVEIQNSARAAGISGNTFFDTLKKGWEKFGGWSLVTRSMMAAYRTIKNMVTAVKELDAAMTELKKVTDLSEQSYENYLQTATQMSQRIGATLADTVNATADFARLGYDIVDSSALAEAALVYKNVGDGIEDISEASESIISTIKAFEKFGVTASDAMSIVDKFNEVGNNFAISSEGIGVALQKSASSLASANNTLEESIALITGMNSVIQNPEIVGTTMKTVSMYLRAAKTEAEEAGESTDGMANSVSELRDELLRLTNQQVDIMIDDTTFKSTYQIMKELSEVWEGLSDIDTANILELIGGKRNATAVTSLLTNFKDAEAALLAATNAAGSATVENEKYLDSINGKLSILQSKFESFSNNLIDSDIVKFVVDAGSALLTALDTLQKIHVLLPLIALSVAAVMGHMNASKISGIAQQIVLQKNALLQEKMVSDQLALSLTGLNAKQRQLLLTELDRAVATDTLTAEQKAQIVSTLGLAGAEGTLSVANKGLAASFKTLMASIPVWGWIALAITVVIEAVTALTSAFSENKQAAIDHANEIVDAYNTAKDTYDSNAKSLAGMRVEFEKLSRGVDENGNNISLTADEYATYLSLVEQIIDISPDVCLGYDKEGKAILNYKTVLDDAIASQEAYIQNQRNIYLGQGEEIFDGKKSEYEDAKKELGNAAGANDLWDESLDDAINPGFWETLFDMDGAQAKLDAYNDAFEQLGIQWRVGIDTWRESTDSVMQMYENADEIMVILRNSGAYTEDELIKIEERLNGLAGAYTKLTTIEKEQVNYLSEWSKDQDWYDIIPSSALDEFVNGLAEVNQPMAGFSENLKAASQFGRDFTNALETDGSQKILDMAEGLKDGSVSLTEYNAAVNNFKSSFDGDEAVLNSLVSYFESLSNNAQSAAESNVAYTKSLSDLSDTIDALEDAYKILNTAKEEMENGGLSNDTIQSIMDVMEEGENYLDYLKFENGQIKLNTQAWEERAASTMIGDLDEIQKETNSLIAQNRVLEEKIEYAKKQRSIGWDGGVWSDQIDEYTAQLEANNEKIKENQDLLGMYGAIYDSVANSMVDIIDFSDMITGLNGIEGTVNSLVSAMDSLASGTALTKQELVKLALEYPKLLEASNIFTDGSIDGQKSMLENILQVYENEYNATIDKEIAKLEATNIALENRIKAEQEKADILSEIKAEEVNNNAEYAAWLAEQLARYNDIEGQNYVAYQDGVLQVTEDALNEILRQESDKAKTAAENIWAPQATTIASSYAEGGSAGLQALNTVGSRIAGWIASIKEKFLSLARTIAAALTGKESNDDTDATGIDTYIDTDVGDVNFTGGDVTINGKSLDEWTSEQAEITRQRIDALRSQIDTNLTAIENLRELKGLDLTTIYKPDSSSDSGKDEIEEYIADIDAYYDALKRLEKAQALRASIEKQLSNTDDPSEKIALERQLIDAYTQEAEAERNLMDLKSQTIVANANALRELGFAVSYNSETNELYISNLEHLNELVATSCGEYETLEEATNALRKSTEELIDSTETLNDDNRESAETIEDISYAISDSKENIIGYISDMAAEAKESLDGITSVYETLRSAVESYNKNGYLTVDMFQSIMDMGTEYLSFLYDENGAIKFNEEAIQELIAAKIENLAVTKAMALVDTVKEYKDDAEALKSLADATYQATDATWGLVYANLAAIGLDDDMYTAFLHQIQTIQQLAASAKENIGASFGSFGSDASSAYNDASNSLEDYYNEASDALDYILDKTQDLIEYEVEQQVEAIQKQIDSYKELIDLKKEALEQTKAEEDYEESVAEKVKDIAELQARIDQLSLDNSREAQAERNTLMAELAEKQKDLADTQDDHAHDAQIDALDKLSSAYEEEKQTEIEILENSISSTEKIYQLAIQRIQDNWGTLYQELINWNMIAGNDINSNITENWIKAAQAVQTYGSYVQAVASVQAGLEQTSSTQGNTIGNTIPKYHSGGVVSDKLNENEVLAILEKGEVVLNEQKKESLYEIIDFQSELSKRLGVVLDSMKLSTSPLNIVGDVDNLPANNIDNSSKLVFEPHIEVEIHHSGNVSDSDAKDYGEQIADITIDKLYSAFERKGINSIRSATLKP